MTIGETWKAGNDTESHRRWLGSKLWGMSLMSFYLLRTDVPTRFRTDTSSGRSEPRSVRWSKTPKALSSRRCSVWSSPAERSSTTSASGGRSKLIASQRATEFLFDRDEFLREYPSRLEEDGEIIIDL
ncbi:hypothetical protein [Nocardia xishanensis]|uniref:Uncharacterized protein n=2 Tax=Nocardia xishanensis TaxID=238964 RepID=A0ABW7XC00_9NOCA